MPQSAVSRILSAFARLRELRRDDHSSSPGIADGIKRPTRKLRTDRPLIRLRSPARALADSVPLFGLAPCGVLPAICLTADAVRSYRTFSPLLAFARPMTGEGERYIFCATSPSGHPDRALPGALPFGVRTFLSPCGKRSSGRLQHRYCTSHSD